MAEKKVKKTAMPDTEKRYYIVAEQSRKTIEAGEDDSVYLMKMARRKNQQWDLKPAEDGFVQLVSAFSGKVLDVVWEGVENGARIHQWEYAGGQNQQWVLEPAENGSCKIKARASGRCLDVVDMCREDGAKLQIWDDCGGENQRWILKEVKPAGKKTSAAGKKKSKAEKKNA